MSHGIFEELESSDSSIREASKQSQQRLAAAIYDVREKYGEFLNGASALDEFHDRVALVKTDMLKTVDQHLMPVTGVMRRVVKACKDEWRKQADKTGPAMHVDNTFSPSDGDLVPEGDFKGYLDSVDQGAESKISDRFEGGDVQRHEKDPADTDFVKDSRVAGPEGNYQWPGGERQRADDEKASRPENKGKNWNQESGALPREGSLALQVFSDWCQSEGLRTASIDSLDKYAENLSDVQYFKLAAELQRTALGLGGIMDAVGQVGGMVNQGVGEIAGLAGGLGGGGVAAPPPAAGGPGPTNDLAGAPGGMAKGGSRRVAQGKGSTDYLQKADEALTNLLNQKAEEFQESVQALQQALQTVQQAEQAQAVMNPMGVQPPAGTVNVLPGQDAAAAGGLPGDPAAGGMPPDPNAAAGGQPPMDPTQMMASRRQADGSWRGKPVKPQAQYVDESHPHGGKFVKIPNDGYPEENSHYNSPGAKLLQQHTKPHYDEPGSGGQWSPESGWHDASIHKLDDPGECKEKDGDDSAVKGQKGKSFPKDWYRRDNNQQFVGKRQGGAAPFAKGRQK